MTEPLRRRTFLRLALVGATVSVAAACAPASLAPPNPTTSSAAPTLAAKPTTAPAAAPTTAPTAPTLAAGGSRTNPELRRRGRRQQDWQGRPAHLRCAQLVVPARSPRRWHHATRLHLLSAEDRPLCPEPAWQGRPGHHHDPDAGRAAHANGLHPGRRSLTSAPE